jgi:hypothetical protein
MKLLKISTLVLGLAAFAFGAKAQSTTPTDGIRLSVGADAGIPTGDFSDSFNWSLGGSAQGELGIAKNLAVTLNAGYNNFFAKTIAGNTAEDLHLLPVKAGLKFFPVNNVYIQGEAGASFLLNKDKGPDTRSAAFAYAPQVGVVFPVGSNFIDAGVRYEGTSTFTKGDGSNLNFFALRVAYSFKL